MMQLARGASLRVWPLSKIVHRHFRARMAPAKWDAVNKTAKQHLREYRPSLDMKQRGALATLRRDGVYTSSVADFVGNGISFDRLRADADRLLADPAVRRQIETRHSHEGVKWYVVRAFGYKPQRPVPRSFVDLLLHDRVLSVVNTYLGVTSRLKYLDVWHNFAVSETEPPIDSELWHRDNEDRKLVKLFIHLSDVDDGSGPLSYFRGSQPDGPFGALFPNDPPTGSYPPERELASKLTDASVKICTGKAGTMVFFDACGLHRGGRAAKRARTLLVATYASDAALDLLKYRLDEPEQLATMSLQARYALHAAPEVHPRDRSGPPAG